MKFFYKEHVYGYIMTGIINNNQDAFLGFTKIDKTCHTCYFKNLSKTISICKKMGKRQLKDQAMNRKEFIKFVGTTPIAKAAAINLVSIKEAEDKILLLEKKITGIDFVIKHIVSIQFRNNENLHESITLSINEKPKIIFGERSTAVKVEFEIGMSNGDLNPDLNNWNPFLLKKTTPNNFTFDLDLKGTIYSIAESLNGRKFITNSCIVNNFCEGFIPRVTLTGFEDFS